MALKTDRKTLTKEIKKAAKSGGNFVYCPPGGAKMPPALMLSKKKISISERKIAKSVSGSAKVYYGTCIKEGQEFIFQCAINPPDSLGKRLKKSIVELTNYKPGKVTAVFAEDALGQDFADDDDLKDMAAVRRKSVMAAAKWVSSASPAGSVAITRIMHEGHGKFESGDFKGAIDSYDSMLSAVADAHKAASEQKADEPEPEGLKRKKLGEDYVGEDKKTGWRAPDLSDQQLSRGALLRLVHQSASYKDMDTSEFMALVKSKDAGVMKLIGLLEGALAKGDKATVEKISKIKTKLKEDRQEIQDSDRVTTEYYTPAQRKKHGLEVGKDGLLYDSEGELFDERKGFVLDPDTGNLVVFRGKAKQVGDGKTKTTHHSSPLAGGDVAGAGHIKGKEGRVTSIDDASGHYKPDATFTLQTLKQLEKLGAKLVDDTIVDDWGDEVSAKKKQKFKVVKAYEKERKQKLKQLLTLWKRDVEAGKVKAGKPPELPPYDANIAVIRDKLLRDGVGPSQKSTKVKLQGKTGLSQEQFDASKGNLKEVNKILKEMTGKKDFLPDDIQPGVLNSRPALNLKIGELLKRKLSKEQFEQTGGNEDQIRKKDVLSEEIKTKGRKSAIERALKDLGAANVLAGASKVLGVPENRLKILSQKTLEESLLGANEKEVLKELKEMEERRSLEDEALVALDLKRDDAGVEEGLQRLGDYDLNGVIRGTLEKKRALYDMGLLKGEDVFWN